MQPFMGEDFLLTNQTARTLYHDYAEDMPIIDYHCHINPAEIAQNKRFDNISQMWLNGDHYKWRMIRANGVDEKYITGDASDREKFQYFAEALPKAIGNPLYHWTHLELKRYFHCDLPISGSTAEEIWRLTGEKLRDEALSVRGVIASSRVKAIATTDDPADTLSWHKAIRNDASCTVTVVPCFRPDKALNPQNTAFSGYIQTLAEASGLAITTLEELYAALLKRMDFFDAMGCRASDHGLDFVAYRPDPRQEAGAVFRKALDGQPVTTEEAELYRTALMVFLGQAYAKRDWVMQIHYGVLRNTNTRMFAKVGADAGFDTIGTYACARGIVDFLDALEQTGELPKTVLYSINPSDNAVLGSAIGSFQSAGIPGKIQHGSAWWFNDTKTGMEEQLKSLANLSLLGNFIGMLTDSRSFLSYTRHEYFRRILCNLLGGWVENGEYPNHIDSLGAMVQDICYNNTARYFRFDV